MNKRIVVTSAAILALSLVTSVGSMSAQAGEDRPVADPPSTKAITAGPALKSQGSFGGPEYASSPTEEAALGKVGTLADSAGAVGLYRSSDDRMVIRVPKGELGNFKTQDVSGFAVEYAPSQFTKSALNETRATAKSLIAKVATDPVSYSIDYDAESDEVVVTGELPTAAIKELGELTGVAASEGSAVDFQSRGSDYAPHWGGALITNYGWTYTCTSGFAVHGDSGTDYTVIAGHCDGSHALGVSMYSPHDANLDNTPEGAPYAYGTVAKLANYHTRDVALVSGSSYDGRVYMGTSTSGTGYPVSSAADPNVGSSYCTSGVVTKQVCGRILESLNGEVCSTVGSGIDCINYLARYSGGTATQDGDSGGPLVNLGSSSVGVRAIHIARQPSTGDMFGTRWETIIALWPALSIIED